MKDFIKRLKDQGISLDYGQGDLPVSYSFKHAVPANPADYQIRTNLTEEDIEIMKTITREQWNS